MSIRSSFYAIAAMAMMSGMCGNMFDDSTPRTITQKRVPTHVFRRKREDETDEEYEAAWHEYRKQRIAEDCAKKGLTVFEINGELIPAKNEREAQKRYKHRHK